MNQRRIILGLIFGLPWLAAPNAAGAVDYLKDIKPLLKQRCSSCHGSVKQEGDLRLDAGALIPKRLHAEILLRVSSADESNRMPPEGARLTAEQIASLREWIDDGARYPKEATPKDVASHWSFQPVKSPPVPASPHEHPIDAFLFRSKPAQPPAPPESLLRRAYLDLIGLPPTCAEQDRFATDQNLSTVIDELLKRPEHGERWARHWLDVVRYADTNGYERDAAKPFVWRYRDYVIESLNSDKPVNQFIIEQIAGDELPEASLETQIATGFLRLGPWDDEPADPLTDRFDQLNDIVSTTAQAFLGLTIECARCHDHKFEPLSTRDYYSLVAVFNPLERPQKGRTEQTLKIEDMDVYAWSEPSAQPKETHILVRGAATNPGDRVEPAVPAILGTQHLASSPGEKTTRQRLALARWIASEQNPLTARVIVNRVWQQHFGEGLVKSANDFGLMGTPPTHPELLDWLAHWFTHDAHWSLKKLHQLILTSRAWQSQKNADSLIRHRRLEVEAIRDSILAVSGKLNPRRFGPPMLPPIPLAAVEANTDKSKVWEPSEESETFRRSIYVFIKRGLVVPFFETLDLPDTTGSCARRQVTITPPQALTLFNSDFVHQQAGCFAERLRREAGERPADQVDLAFRLALCRKPTDSEQRQVESFLSKESLEQFCRVMFNLNEFVYAE